MMPKIIKRKKPEVKNKLSEYFTNNPFDSKKIYDALVHYKYFPKKLAKELSKYNIDMCNIEYLSTYKEENNKTMTAVGDYYYMD